MSYIHLLFIDNGLRMDDDVFIDNTLQRCGIMALSDVVKKETQVTEY